MQWIKTSERLPESRDKLNSQSHAVLAWDMGCYIAFYSHGAKQWVVVDNLSIEINPSHWAPITPPTEGE